MMSLLSARLGAARVALRSREGKSRELISSAQAAAVVELASREPGLPSFSAEQRAHLVTIATDAPWVDADLRRILEALAESPAKKTQQEKKERPMQTWAPAILGYFTNSQWAQILDVHDRGAAEDCVIRHVLQLGARRLSEPTLKCLSSLLLLASNPHAIALPTHLKKSFYDNFKNGLKRKARRLGPAEHDLVVLPEAPRDFQANYPALYRKVQRRSSGPRSGRLL